MEYIKVTKENLEEEHICCAISNNKDVQVSSKKAWLSERFDEGLVFLKSVERGKCFIEYIPVENAWIPIDAPGYIYIDCPWVSGSLKGHGYSSDLLSECIKDSKDKEMLKLGLKYSFEVYGAKKVSLGVFENNEPAYYCYKAAGFNDVILEESETYTVLGEEWKCKEMVIER